MEEDGVGGKALGLGVLIIELMSSSKNVLDSSFSDCS